MNEIHVYQSVGAQDHFFIKEHEMQLINSQCQGLVTNFVDEMNQFCASEKRSTKCGVIFMLISLLISAISFLIIEPLNEPLFLIPAFLFSGVFVVLLYLLAIQEQNRPYKEGLILRIYQIPLS